MCTQMFKCSLLGILLWFASFNSWEYGIHNIMWNKLTFGMAEISNIFSLKERTFHVGSWHQSCTHLLCSTASELVVKHNNMAASVGYKVAYLIAPRKQREISDQRPNISWKGYHWRPDFLYLAAPLNAHSTDGQAHSIWALKRHLRSK